MGTGTDVPGVFTEIAEAAEQAARALIAAPPTTRRESALEDLLAKSLTGRIGREAWSAVERQFSLKDPAWPGVGPVDLTLDLPEEGPVLIELKWDDLPACAWDMSKLALAVANGHASAGVLVALAPTDNWESNPGAELFDPRGWRVDLLLERFASNFAYWATDVNTRPERLPSGWNCGEFFHTPLVLDGEECQLRGVMIEDAEPDLVEVEYRPVALMPHRRAAELGLRAMAKPEPIEGAANPEQALQRGPDEEFADARTVVQGEGGGYAALDLSGLQSNEMDEAERFTANQRWFASPGQRRLYLEQRGLRQPRSSQPEVFQVYSGSGMGPRTSLDWNGHHLQVSRFSIYGDGDERLVQPTDYQWACLWRTLDRLDVWSWAPDYQPAMGVTDAHGWSIDIAFVGRSARSGGYHAYPDGADDSSPVWHAFELALEDLIVMPLYDHSQPDMGL